MPKAFDIEAYLGGFIGRVKEVTKDPGVRADWLDVYEQMIVHTRGLTPEKLLSNTRPNEPPNIMEYRLENYEPITQDGIEKGLDRLSRIFLNSNFRLTPSKRISEYIEEKKFFVKQLSDDPMSFEQLMLGSILRADIEDPNAVLAWFPVNSQDSSLPPAENPETEKIEVKPKLVWSKHIIDYSEDIFSFQAGLWSFVHDKQTFWKPFYYVMDTMAIYIVTPVGFKDGEVEYQFDLYYQLATTEENAFEMVPGVLLKGEQVANREDEVYYQSFFNGYLAAANEAIRAFSDNQAVSVQCNFPVIAVKGQKCYKCGGSAKVEVETREDGGPKYTTCEVCGGTGQTASLSPNSTYIKQPPGPAENEGFVLSPAVEFFSPDIGIIDKSFERWEALLDRAERSINVKFSEDAQSGVSKDKDLEQMLDMLTKISKNMFRIIDQSLDIIEAYREPFATNREGSIIIEPSEFRIKTSTELTTELTDLIQKKAPQSFIFNAAQNLSKELYNGDPVKQKVVEIQGLYDPLFGKNIDDIVKLKATGAINDLDMQRHVNAFNVLMMVAMANKDKFVDLDFAQIKEQADALLPEITPIIPLTTPDGNPT